MLSDQQVEAWGKLSVNDRRNAMISHFGYGLLAQAWSELESKRPTAPKDAALYQPEPVKSQPTPPPKEEPPKEEVAEITEPKQSQGRKNRHEKDSD